jgi:hypothetical protein
MCRIARNVSRGGGRAFHAGWLPLIAFDLTAFMMAYLPPKGLYKIPCLKNEFFVETDEKA